MTLLIVSTFFLGVAFLLIGIRAEQKQHTPMSRLHPAAKPAAEPSPEEVALQRPLLERVLGPTARKALVLVSRWSPPGVKDAIRRRLIMAGNPWRWHSDEVIFAKATIAFTGALVAFWIALRPLNRGLESAILFGLVGLAAGFQLPDAIISRQARRRQRQIQRSLPYVLDLLCISVEAGLSFNAAMQKVAEHVPGPLTDEFKQVAYEVLIGKPQRDALRDMRDRCGVEDLSTFTAAVAQAERLGLGIANVLRVQSEQLRNVRRERARQHAMKIPVKMLFPLVFLILPALFVIILGPALIQVSRSMIGAK
ncbi:MAG: type II secretion system F family protein [Armatimonadetes bacterium]|nr:type II secretion system F family protein [Armatimonadota bacterium]